MPLRAVLALALVAACVPVPGPARPAPPPDEARGAFSPSASVKAILLDLVPRGVPGAVAERVGRLVSVALGGNRVEVRHETDLQAFWDADSRARLVGRGTDVDLARVARRFGADVVLAGWVGRSGKAFAFDVRAVDPQGRVVARAAAVWRGNLTDFYVAARQAAEHMDLGPPPKATADASRIAWAVHRHHGAFESCLAEGVLLDPALSGEATLDLVVSPEGTVSSAALRDSTFANDTVETCLKDAATSLSVPAGARAPVTVTEHVSLPAEAPKGDTSLPNP